MFLYACSISTFASKHPWPISIIFFDCVISGNVIYTRNKARLGYHHSRLHLWGWKNPLSVSSIRFRYHSKTTDGDFPQLVRVKRACDVPCCQLYRQVVFHWLGVFIGRTNVIPTSMGRVSSNTETLREAVEDVLDKLFVWVIMQGLHPVAYYQGGCLEGWGSVMGRCG